MESGALSDELFWQLICLLVIAGLIVEGVILAAKSKKGD